ncbi:MAG: DUF447 family protein [Nitrososphaerota archaeon]|nr:DUF447 family protein [Nitrososphaerota archaeon]
MTARFQADVKEKLSEFGFKKAVIYESIVSTSNPDKTPNAAPMGIKLIDDKYLNLTIFNSSTTLQNLKTQKCAVINFTDDIEIFYKSAFKKTKLPNKNMAHWFVQAEFVEAPKLRVANLTLEVSVIDFKPLDTEKTKVTCKIEHTTSQSMHPQLYSRAATLTLEAVIHGTRIETYLNKPQKQTEIIQLMEKIHDCTDVVERVAPNSIYTTILSDLQKQITLWRQKP